MFIIVVKSVCISRCDHAESKSGNDGCFHRVDMNRGGRARWYTKVPNRLCLSLDVNDIKLHVCAIESMKDEILNELSKN